ncbi:hypothetical protein D3C81_861090 [compost metagenome]
MLVGVVGVHAMGVVRRDHQRTLHGADILVAVGQQALQGLLKHRAIGATGRARAHFFVVVAHQHAGFVAVGAQQRLQAGIARQQVVQAGAGDEVAVEADQRGILGVVEAQLVIEHHIGVELVLTGQLLGEQGAEVDALVARDLRQDRRQLVLRVDRPAFVGGAIEVDRQVGNDRDRQLEVDQLAFDLAVTTEGHPAGQRQVTVEPRCQQCAAIHFDAQLQETLTLQLGLRLDPQARAVGVGADHADTAVQRRLLAKLDGDDRGVVAGHVVSTAGHGGPAVALVQALVAGSLEAQGQAGGGVEGRWGGLEEFDQAGIQCIAHSSLQTAVARV